MVHNHLKWESREDDPIVGDLYAMGAGFSWLKLSDNPIMRDVTFTEACELTAIEFPPRVAVRRHIGRTDV